MPPVRKPSASPAAKSATTVSPPVAKRSVGEKTGKAVSESPSKPVKPVAPETKKDSASKRKRLSKAFSRPLDKKLQQTTLVRDRFTFPEDEYARLIALKKELSAQGLSVKKSELVRAGLLLLSALEDEALKEILAKVPAVG